MGDLIRGVIAIIVIVICLSFLASMLKLDRQNCGKKYPVDYILYTNLFCENK